MSIDWDMILADEKRIIENSDRKYRDHFYSTEALGENVMESIIYKQSLEKYQQEDIDELLNLDFMDTIESEQLRKAVEKLSSKQRQAIELYFRYGYNHREIAQIMGCKRRNVTDLISRAVGYLGKHL